MLRNEVIYFTCYMGYQSVLLPNASQPIVAFLCLPILPLPLQCTTYHNKIKKYDTFLKSFFLSSYNTTQIYPSPASALKGQRDINHYQIQLTCSHLFDFSSFFNTFSFLLGNCVFATHPAIPP